MLRTATLITQNYRQLESPPLGLLVVAERLRELGVAVEVFDLAAHWRAEAGVEAACAHCADLLAERDCEWFGFSTIAGVMPITVAIARLLRERRPEAAIGFGGPGVSAVAEPFVTEFREFDFVLQGEVEGALPVFVETFATADFASCPNLVQWRAGGVRINPLAPLQERFPTPFYERWGYANAFPVAPVEVGRGCPYNCKFCCTSAFFSRRYRIKEPSRLLDELTGLLKEWQPQQVNFVHDLFTVNEARVAQICQKLIDSDIEVSWQCSSRLGCISDDLIALMAEAGCQNIVFGIETGSPRMQKVIGKRLAIETTFDVAETCAAHGIAAGCSFILGFPEESLDELNQTLELWMDLMAIRYTEPHGAILAALGGTDYYKMHLEQGEFTALHTRALPPRSGLSVAQAELIRSHPCVFPEFYALPYAPLPRLQLKLIEEFMNAAGKTIRYLLAGLRRLRMTALEIVLEWFDYAGLDRLARQDETYFLSAEFVQSFVEFYRERLAAADLAPPERRFLDGLAVAYEVTDREPPPAEPVNGPALAAAARLRQGPVSINHLPLRLRRGVMPQQALRPAWYLQTYRGGRCETFELHPTLGEVLARCDGLTSVAEIARQVSVMTDAEKNEAAVAYLLAEMAAKGHVRMPASHERATPEESNQPLHASAVFS